MSQDKIIEEAKGLEEKPFPLTKTDAQTILACLGLASFVMGSHVRKNIIIIDPDLMMPMALVGAIDPKAEITEQLIQKITDFIDPKIGADWRKASEDFDARG